MNSLDDLEMQIDEQLAELQECTCLTHVQEMKYTALVDAKAEITRIREEM